MAKTALQIQADYTSQLAQGKNPNQHEFTQALAKAQKAEEAAKKAGTAPVSAKVKRKEREMGSQYVTGADPKKDYEKYVKKDDDLKEAFQQLSEPGSKEANYWLSRMGGGTDMAAFGRAHAMESQAIANKLAGRPGGYLGRIRDDLPEGWTARDVPDITVKKPVEPPEEPEEPEEPEGPRSQSVVSGLEAFDMAELSDDMMLSNRLKDIINTNSPLFKAARTKALQAMQARGLVNSSMAEEAVMNALLAVAMPIAQAEVNALQTNLYYNTDWTNAQKQMANDYYYKTMVMKLGKEMDYQLQYMVQSFGAWGKYGDWVNRLGTTPGMDVGAIEWNLNQLPQLPEWFYNWK